MSKRLRQRCGSRLIEASYLSNPLGSRGIDERGAAALMMMVVILAVGILIVSTTAFIGIDDLEIGFSQEAGNHALLAAESCVEEAMLRLSRDSFYTGGSLNVGESTCAIVVTGTPCGGCTIDVESTRNNFTRRIEAGVSVTGGSVDITSWQEKD